MEKPCNRDTGHQGHSAHQQLEAKLLEAVERGDYREATPEFWERLEAIAEGKPERKSKHRQS